MDPISQAIQTAKQTTANSPAAAYWRAVRAKEEQLRNMPISSIDGDEDGKLCKFNPPNRSFIWIESIENWQRNSTPGACIEAAYDLAAARCVDMTHVPAKFATVARELEARRQRGVAIQEAASLEQKKRRILIERAPSA